MKAETNGLARAKAGRLRRLPSVLRHYATDFDREDSVWMAPDSDLGPSLRLAADEIERLRKEVKR